MLAQIDRELRLFITGSPRAVPSGMEQTIAKAVESRGLAHCMISDKQGINHGCVGEKQRARKWAG
jgi:hypothetical protein